MKRAGKSSLYKEIITASSNKFAFCTLLIENIPHIFTKQNFNRMKLKKLFFAGLLIAATTSALNAQSYNTALGVRLGYDSGLTLKHFFAPANAAEFILSASPRYFQLTGLYEYQQPVPGAPNLDWYLGLGAHIGSIHHNKEAYSSAFLLGADLIAGLEYIFPQAPFTVSLDWKPSFNFTNSYNDYWYSGFALSLRYTLK
jgi:hypothetical protein